MMPRVLLVGGGESVQHRTMKISSKLTLRDRDWTCKECGSYHDRDLLAARNIKHFGLLRQNKKIGWEAPESTPLETVALAASMN